MLRIFERFLNHGPHVERLVDVGSDELVEVRRIEAEATIANYLVATSF